MVSDAIAKGNVQAINYFLGVKYVEALQQLSTAPNQKVILMPLEAANVIGAIGGIAELAKSALGQQQAGQAGGPWNNRPQT
jgi:regulator of protease activity HflC (stomatin/prohibitin superfamily)